MFKYITDVFMIWNIRAETSQVCILFRRPFCFIYLFFLLDIFKYFGLNERLSKNRIKEFEDFQRTTKFFISTFRYLFVKNCYLPGQSCSEKSQAFGQRLVDETSSTLLWLEQWHGHFCLAFCTNRSHTQPSRFSQTAKLPKITFLFFNMSFYYFYLRGKQFFSFASDNKCKIMQSYGLDNFWCTQSLPVPSQVHRCDKV